MKKTFETFSIVTFIFVVLLGLLAWYIKLTIFTPQTSLESNVLGVEDEKVNSIEISTKNQLDINNKILTFSSAEKYGNVLYFDNTTREFIEGISKPNSSITLILGKDIVESQTDPNGFFSFKLPSNTGQYSNGQIIVYNSDNEVIGGFRFTLILKFFESRHFFYYPVQKQVFSLVISEDYTANREDPYILSNFQCKATIRRDVSSTSFDFVKNNNLLIFPTNILNLNFNENKFITIEVKNEIAEIEQCFDKWNIIGSSLRWERSFDLVETIEEVPISSPIKID